MGKFIFDFMKVKNIVTCHHFDCQPLTWENKNLNCFVANEIFYRSMEEFEHTGIYCKSLLTAHKIDSISTFFSPRLFCLVWKLWNCLNVFCWRFLCNHLSCWCEVEFRHTVLIKFSIWVSGSNNLVVWCELLEDKVRLDVIISCNGRVQGSGNDSSGIWNKDCELIQTFKRIIQKRFTENYDPSCSIQGKENVLNVETVLSSL